MKTHSLLAATLGAIILTTGCSATGAAWQTLRVGKNLAKKDSYLKIYIDGAQAKQNKLKKAYMGYASFKCKAPVSTSPTFRFDFIDPAKFGRITGTNMQIHQAFEADYSHQPEFVITPRSSGADNLMKPGIDYNLGNPPSQFRVLDFEHNETTGVSLKPGMKYLLVFTVSGDRSETVQILFETR